MAARLIVVLAVAALVMTARPARARQDASPSLPRLVFDVDGTPMAPPPVPPAAVKVTVTASAPDDIAARVAATAGWPVWLVLTGIDATDVDAAAWPARVQAILAQVPTLAAVQLQADAVDPRRAAFLIKLTAAEVRARGASIPIVLGGEATSPSRREAVVTADVAPSIDAIAVPPGSDVVAAAAWLAGSDPGAALVDVWTDVPGTAAATTFVASELARLGSVVAARGYRVSERALREILPVASRLRDLYAGDVAPVTTAEGAVTIRRGGEDVTAGTRWRMVYNLASLGTYLLIESDVPGEQRLELSVLLPSAGTVVLRDPVSGRDRPALGVARDDVAQRTLATVVLPGPGTWLVDFTSHADGGFVQREDVTAARTPTVEEILARHQARQAIERDLAPRYVMNGRIQQYFRPTVTDPGYDVITENRFFVDRVEGTEWEEREFSVNGARFGEPRPPFPLLQAEKVLSPPLAIELDARYSYRLEGTATIDGRAAWVIRFDPQRRDQSLYRGTVWIDRDTYARLRQQAAQTALSAPVISSDETQDFAPVRTASGAEVYLPSRTYTQQLILIAGRNLLVERRGSFSGHEIAPADFAAQRQEARGGQRTMYRETDVGVRYFVKEGDQRVVSDIATTRARALALGVTIDPGFEFPLPIGGINYLNFRFRGRPDTQVAVLFAGVLAAGNIQRPKAIANRIDASIDFFAIAPPSTDRTSARRGRSTRSGCSRGRSPRASTSGGRRRRTSGCRGSTSSASTATCATARRPTST